MAEQKRKEPTFYRVLHRTDKFNPGEHIELERSVEFDRWNVDRSDLAELVKLPLQELQAKRKDGATAEKTIFGKVQVAAEEWVEQAAQTMLLDRAIEYVKTPEVKHTSNEWKRQKDGVWEISNRVYIMRYKIMQETTGNHQGQWLVTWGIAINRPPRPSTEKYYYSGDVMVVEIKKKYYNAEADAQNYIQGRFDVYARLFTELSPPVPDEFKRSFYINGVLLPGYTIAPKERAPPGGGRRAAGLAGRWRPCTAVRPGAAQGPEEIAPAPGEGQPGKASRRAEAESDPSKKAYRQEKGRR